ncbi:MULTISPECIES: efflux RND transporter periplasmic adaptor subunit [Pseudoxanthomonas]|uniref:HlyD family secretion protein n=1 Tax=Pseudoxanthomonas taiwanensis J19 TaxID=935569 RepID=A0A562D9P6_9GAMM|nr:MULTISPECIES: efflux RND transporter periplasmic adaptor subunit [Pseudoxanthomonas]TWH06346.1 HlyD family secretion protein [Pseudoxanthomonas taiwanensis J19]
MSRTSRPNSRPRWLPLAGGVLVLALLGGAAWYWGGASRDAEAAWRTAPVERGNIRVAISSTGTLSATSTVTVGSQISGQVLEVLVDYNDRVTEGQVLARIDPKTYEAQIAQGNAQVASAQASLRQAQAALANAEADYQRKAALVERQLIARSDVDLAKAALDQARAQVASAQAQIRQQAASTETTRVNLERTVIRSPVNGVVLTRSIEPGQTVAASLQAPELFTIAEDLSKMKIELSVDEADIGQVKPGQRVSFTVDAFPDRQFRGEVQQVRLAATTNNNVVTYPVVVSVDNSDGTLLPGLTVNAEIEVSRRDDVLKVSNAALRYKPADQPAAAAAPGRGPRGAGMLEDLAAFVAGMDLAPAQKSAFEADLAAARQRQEEMRKAMEASRQATPQQRPGAGGPPMMMMGGARQQQANAGGQMRQRMLERFQQDFAGFFATLQPAQREAVERELANLAGARRATVYRLEGGKPVPVMVRLGASDGSITEISGNVTEGDLLVTGERAAAR